MKEWNILNNEKFNPIMESSDNSCGGYKHCLDMKYDETESKCDSCIEDFLKAMSEY